MSYNNEDTILTKVNSFFDKLKNENSFHIPTILYTYGKQFSIFEKEIVDTLNIDTILNNINNNENEDNNIIILDSSFNPPTLAHIKLITETFSYHCEQLLLKNKNNNNENLNLTFILLITNNNVDKKLIGANLSQRLLMMEIVSDIFQKQVIKIANEKYQFLKNQ
eukprot:jgi/Orpsp1_1/1179315/evm.model.c7180000068857.1